MMLVFRATVPPAIFLGLGFEILQGYEVIIAAEILIGAVSIIKV